MQKHSPMNHFGRDVQEELKASVMKVSNGVVGNAHPG